MSTQRRSSHDAPGRLGSVKFTFPARNLKLRRRQRSTITGPGIFPPPGKKRCRPCHNAPRDAAKSSVRLLESGAGTGTAELLGLGSSGVGDEEGAVEVDEGSLQLVLGVLVDVLLVVGDDGLGDGLADGVDLGSVTTTGDTDTDVEAGELVEANDQQGLVDLDR